MDKISFEQLDSIIELFKNVLGYDLSHYSKSSLKRRINRVMELLKVDYYDFKIKLINDPATCRKLIDEIVVNFTEMFRDPEFYSALKAKVFPYLSTYPHLKIWSAGCSSGEEVYSLAIKLTNAGLYHRSFIYGTDISSRILDEAKKGIYKLSEIKSYSENYLKTNPPNSLSEYYTAMYDNAIIHQELKKNILFSTHNLVSDGVFNQFHMIVCRNVLIYFDKTLQEHVLQLFYDSLEPFGFLCLGSKESMINFKVSNRFKVIDKKLNIFQKIS